MPKARQYSPTQRAAEGAVLTIVDRHAPRDPKTKQHPPLIGADGAIVTLTMMGADSMKARRLDYHTRAEFQNRVFTRALSGEKQTGSTPDDVAEQELKDVEKCAQLLRAWTGVTEDDGSPSPCTYENAVALFKDDTDVREQALAFVEDRPRFFAQCSTPSVATVPTSSDSGA
jgi:hypothetical protein